VANHKQKNAFTLIELIMVIVVLGIVASIGASMIAQTYQSYIMQKAIHNASFKTELVANSIANRLAYRIDTSVVARKPGQTGNTIGTDIYGLITIPDAQKKFFTILEWVNYENDGFTFTGTPGWSAFSDLNSSSFDTISSPGSDFTTENIILGNLGYTGNPAIMFMGGSGIYRTDTNASYGVACTYQSAGCMFPVTLAGTTLTFAGGDRSAGNMKYSEFYQLAASAYAVVPSNPHTINGINVWDLFLHSNYQPWDGENYTGATRQSLLARDVSVFRFKQEPNSVRIKICSVQQIGDTKHIAICKEKAVIR
jgi:prepilin-type N-terminal cleavage/methylation domain-containing protein